jgi:hypothetical protein
VLFFVKLINPQYPCQMHLRRPQIYNTSGGLKLFLFFLYCACMSAGGSGSGAVRTSGPDASHHIPCSRQVYIQWPRGHLMHWRSPQVQPGLPVPPERRSPLHWYDFSKSCLIFSFWAERCKHGPVHFRTFFFFASFMERWPINVQMVWFSTDLSGSP